MKTGGSFKQECTTKIALHLLHVGFRKTQCAWWKNWVHRNFDTMACLELLKTLRLADTKRQALIVLKYAKEAAAI